MTVFWSMATAMALLALAFILPPLLRKQPAGRIDRDALNTAVARERLAELRQDLDEGRLDPVQYEAAREDLERELLNDLEPAGENPPRQLRSGRWAALLIAVAIPVTATLLYRTLGSERIIALLQAQPPAPQAQQQAPTVDSIEEMVTRLAARLQQEPDNLRGWLMLAKSYAVLNRYDLALPAYRNILRLGGGNDAGVLADFADALVATTNGEFTDEAGTLLTRALQLDPDHIKALWLAGHWRNQSGDIEGAIRYWEQAAGRMQPGSQDRRVIDRQIGQVRRQAGLPAADARQTATTTGADTAKPAGRGGSLQVTVELDPALRDRVHADDTVFIYARAVNGPRMPLAIVRKQVRDLPLTVTLDDAMAMAPGMVLSGFEEVTVGARISRSGNAMAQSGDLQGLKSPVHTTGTGGIDIVIDTTVP